MVNRGGRPKDIRDKNLRLVSQLFREKGILSIYQVATLADLSRTTAAKLVDQLMEKELLLPVGKGSSTSEGGKKPEMYCFNGSSAYVISAFITKEGLTGVLYDLNCDRLSDQSVSAGDSYETAMDGLAELVEKLLRQTGISSEMLRGIAVGCNGIVDAENGVLRYPIQRNWGNGLPMAQDLNARLPFPVKVHIDSIYRFFGYAEASMVQPRESGCIVTVYSDQTAGGSIIVDNRPLRGNGGFAGELGHVTLEMDNGPTCACGGVGCFEALVSAENVIAGAEELAGGYPQSPLHKWTLWGLEDFFTASNEGDAFAKAVMNRVARRFAALLHNIILLHDPKQIVIQGVYAGAGDYFLDCLRGFVADFPFFQIKRKPVISYSKISFTSQNPDNFALGGALYASDSFLDSQL